ncbi:hypothetical protein A2690_01810 [Candidatus Roizmanbacteria bacterium RIFCSPHIGHO2_01_FULL_39_12b]|uniref:YbaK/aminoacyl-tRNA synthetase-associated domain-containing protein n=1 Tax=Candidatus Roizmanbacteria bacterium RIFCSPHIGHO2_01_FULL_39_12b TaxID=1802030 RepID=A0A1F7GBB4_9BACT|nr:MAG: hypothetical protein A2690_01810 [Candidatus Roizmanbacteria bacterium RIFCSPHIGHO2_01_FULL_39_12b]OGK46157.1 MAG: hypothetical protein A3B46_03055 [Candidatus Roizmanbacteria bacterium RIFCSPLOWO2_01_FULL_39_19]
MFLQNQKGDKFYLIIYLALERADLKSLSSIIREKKLSFASPDSLLKLLNITPGSVSPFGLINDEKHLVCVIVSNSVLKGKKIGFHPNINTSTLAIKTGDFKRFLE